MSEETRTRPGNTLNSPPIALAQIGIVTGEGDRVNEWVYVHFNPASLQLQVSNELKDSENQQRAQYVAKRSAKLTIDLQFDTTDSGEDVTETTRKVQAFLGPEIPPGQSAPQEPPPPVVLFQWGTVKFKGVVETYRETIDFFAANGVPLRALVNLTLSRQDKVFDEAPEGAPTSAGNVDSDLTEAPASSASDLANKARSPGAARGLGALNGQTSLRFGAGASFGVSASVTLNGPVAMVSGGAGFGIGGGAGIGIGGGFGVSGGAGIGISTGGGIGVGGGAGIGVGGGFGVSGGLGVGGSLGLSGGIGGGIGGGAGFSAGPGISSLASLSASEGAFAGLRVSTKAPSFSARIDAGKLGANVLSSGISTDRGASFQAGGRATISGSAGLRADVGTGPRARGRLSFDAD